MSENHITLDRVSGQTVGTFEQCLADITAHHFNVFEFAMVEYGTGNMSAEAFVATVEPHDWRIGSIRGAAYARYQIANDADPIQLANFLVNARSSLRCRLTHTYSQTDSSISVRKLEQTLEKVRASSQSIIRPRDFDDCTAMFYLLETMLGNLDENIRYFDPSGMECGAPDVGVFESEFANENVFGELACGGKVLGVVVPVAAAARFAKYASFPSAQLINSDGDDQLVYLLMGERQHLWDFHSDVIEALELPSPKNLAPLFPLPIGQYRLSRYSSEALEFDERLAIYTPYELADLTVPLGKRITDNSSTEVGAE